MVKLRTLFGCMVCLLVFSGCGTIYDAAVDERDIGTIAGDTSIKGEILKGLADDDEVKAGDITASCYNGHAYLIGEYDVPAQKSKAIAIAKGVEGVKDVTTYLVTKQKSETCGTTDNLAITANVKTALVKDKSIWSTNIDIKTIQCKTVVLWGLVGSKDEALKAVAHAKSVEGVQSVKSFIRTTQQ